MCGRMKHVEGREREQEEQEEGIWNSRKEKEIIAKSIGMAISSKYGILTLDLE